MLAACVAVAAAAQPLAAQAQAPEAGKPAAKAEAAGDKDKELDKTVFYRPATDFGTALADVQECDGYARGISYHIGNTVTPYPYTVAGAVGGAIGTALADAIFGAAERRKLRRVNMRTCMGFKEYRRYSVSEEAWKSYDLGEGEAEEGEDKRELMLRMHAKVASAPAAPKGEIVE
jgi:ribosomal protein L12E/L44/L45/RPP1/RPP2